MNKVFLIGRLTKDPELRYTTSNLPVASFSIAIDRASTNGEKATDFINIVVWRKQAENVKNYLTKGSLVAIDGRIQSRSYDGQDGKKVYITEVVASQVQFLESKSQSQSRSSVNPRDFENNSNNYVETNNNIDEDPFANFSSSFEISDDDLPFE